MNYAFVAAVIVAATLSISSAQSRQPSFEVASIRRNLSGSTPSVVYFQEGRFVAENASVKMIIAYAYRVKDFQISGGPSWLDAEKFDITAKEDDSVVESGLRLPWKEYRAQLGLMVQSLLADRFKLRVSHWPRESSILALVIAKGGLKVNRSTTPDNPFIGNQGAQGPTYRKAVISCSIG